MRCKAIEREYKKWLREKRKSKHRLTNM
jgi:hypothetical protein